MKVQLFTIGLFSLLFSSQATAQEQKKAKPRAAKKAVVNTVDLDFIQIDLDSDGAISLKELKEASKKYEDFDIQKIYKMFDADNDGSISNSEFISNKNVLRKRPGRIEKKK